MTGQTSLMKDWKLWIQSGLLPKGFKEKVKTNFRNSMSVAALHRDSKSGTLHLHLDCCRVDNDGKTNDVHDVHIRAIRAAEIINARHGWEQPQEVREMRQQDIAEFCEYTLQKMDSFDIDRYFDMLRMRGYEVNQGMTLLTANLWATPSARMPQCSRLLPSVESSWYHSLKPQGRRCIPKPTQVKMRPASPSVSPARPARHVAQTTKPTQSNSKPLPVATKTAFNVNVSGEMKRIYIPNTVKDIFLNEVQVPDSDMTASREDISHVGMLLFLDMIDAATTVSESCGGGGSAPSSGWGKDDDEDERERARRCLQMAHAMCKPPQKRRSFHR